MPVAFEITAEQQKEIKRSIDSGESFFGTARRMGLSSNTVMRIWMRQTAPQTAFTKDSQFGAVYPLGTKTSGNSPRLTAEETKQFAAIAKDLGYTKSMLMRKALLAYCKIEDVANYPVKAS